ncbi:hypothetical protein NEOLI_002737 [Neolecta irregularis DAH-3]|uniref:Uncharacterized protein n=1 Tax=Neolecta irregularis (strain DAH-3) TaxID=1198029 RepID=A0A1U7LWS5_NEOID|nr:hypothetical protein NEOLI_002737 [Neolecta irregularis DAH-3]|eukprot:OLL26961.1 hypothetical protein NEOLI_002737 [Neolecta irregularis DAH-3]
MYLSYSISPSLASALEDCLYTFIQVITLLILIFPTVLFFHLWNPLNGFLDLPIGITHAWILVSGLHKIAQRSNIGEIYLAVLRPFVYEGGVLGSIIQTWESPNSNDIRSENSPPAMHNPGQLAGSYYSQTSSDTEEFIVGTDQDKSFVQKDVESGISKYLCETPCDELDISSCVKSLDIEILEDQVPMILELWSKALRQDLDKSTQAARIESIGKLLKQFNEGIHQSRLERNLLSERREIVTSDREAISEQRTEVMVEHDDIEENSGLFQCLEIKDGKESKDFTAEEIHIHSTTVSHIQEEKSAEEPPKPIRKYSVSKGPFTTGWNPGYFGWKPSKVAEPSGIIRNPRTRISPIPEFRLANSASLSSPVEWKTETPSQVGVGVEQWSNIKSVKNGGKKKGSW